MALARCIKKFIGTGISMITVQVTLFCFGMRKHFQLSASFRKNLTNFVKQKRLSLAGTPEEAEGEFPVCGIIFIWRLLFAFSFR